MDELIQKLLALYPPVPGPLNGYIAVEIGGYVSAPVAAEDLARKGALIIKIEQSNGDPSRRALSPAAFASFNAGKMSVVITKQDNDLYLAVLQLAHVIIDNRSPAAKKRDGILQKFLVHPVKAHPVIFCSIVGYDSEQYKDEKAFDVSVQAQTGMAYTNAFSSTHPLLVGFFVLDITTGLYAASCIKEHLLAIQRKHSTASQNEQVILLEISMAKISALFQTLPLLHYLETAEEKVRDGNRNLTLCPFSVYQARDGLVSIAIVQDEQFAEFCIKILNNQELANLYPTNALRVKNHAVIEKAITDVLSTNTCDHWIALCKAHGLTCTRVNTTSQALKKFHSLMITTTTGHTPIIASADKTFAAPSPKLKPAPALNADQETIKQLVTFPLLSRL